MESPLLSLLFRQYPSAFASNVAGDSFQLICPECGTFVVVAVPDAPPQRIDLRCDACGYEDHLGEDDPAESLVAD